jgi:hypothetical protein
MVVGMASTVGGGRGVEVMAELFMVWENRLESKVY